MVLTTYGRSSGFCIDPIEKKPLNHFLPGTPVFSFGTAGCNLTCKFCQNWDISKAREIDRLNAAAAPGRYRRRGPPAWLPLRRLHLQRPGDLPGVRHRHGACLPCGRAQDGGRDRRLHHARPRAAEFFEHIDAANVDLKAFSEGFYHGTCGGHLKDVLDTLVWIRREGRVWLEITTLLIPGENDTDAEITALSRWVARELGSDVPLHFSAFHPDWRMRDRPPTPPATLSRARAIARADGLRYVYTGNVHDPAGASTYCPGCGATVIGRDWYQLGVWGLDPGGKCRACGTPIAGVFEATPGRWGRRRQPVSFRAP